MTTTATAAEIWVITDQAHPVTGDADRRILLDAPGRLEAELATGLPSDPNRAAPIVQQRLKQGSAELQGRLAAAYQSVTDAWSLGITKVPAVIVDRRSHQPRASSNNPEAAAPVKMGPKAPDSGGF